MSNATIRMAGLGRLAIAVLTLAVALAACTRSPEVRLGSGGDCGGDGPGVINGLASAESWLEVVGPSKEFADRSLDDQLRTVVIDMHVAPVTGITGHGRETTEPVAIHASYLAGLDWAMNHDARAFLAMASKDLVREIVDYVVIRPADGDSFFAGECAYDLMTRPLRSMAGPAGANRLIDRLIGMSGRHRILQLLQDPSSST